MVKNMSVIARYNIIIMIRFFIIIISGMTISQTLIQYGTIHRFEGKQNRIFLSLTKRLLLFPISFNIFNFNLI